jgi:folate-binding protein YgfZ
MDNPASAAQLSRFGVLFASGEDARAFLHGQLTSDIQGLAPGRARRAGWCSAKGRLLATLLVVPHESGYLLQLSRDLAPAIAKRLQMFVLRAKVKIADESDAWMQYGLWGPKAGETLAGLGYAAPASDLGVSRAGDRIAVRIAEDRYLVFTRSTFDTNASEDEWLLQEIRAGIPHVTQATQDQFVPQMVNFETLGAVDFQKGCYPGQEIVARAQYRGQVKRRMFRVRSSAPLVAGQELFSGGESVGTVLCAAGEEALAVLQLSTVEAKNEIGGAGGGSLEILTLP